MFQVSIFAIIARCSIKMCKYIHGNYAFLQKLKTISIICIIILIILLSNII